MRVGVSFSIPIEDILEHVEVVLSNRINLQKQADSYDRVISSFRSNENPTSDDLVGVAERIAEIRKGLLEADQALEDTVSILSGYIGFLREKEVGPPPGYQDTTVQAPVASPNKEGVESE
tara:strand:+ start:1069 stop:1428 length:360 start_codon:yes stop_codon:yes gene_type:complete